MKLWRGRRWPGGGRTISIKAARPTLASHTPQLELRERNRSGESSTRTLRECCTSLRQQRSWVKAKKGRKPQKWFSGRRQLSCKVGQKLWKFVQRTSPSPRRFSRSVKCAREAHSGLNRRKRKREYWPIWLVARSHNPTTHRPRWPTGNYRKEQKYSMHGISTRLTRNTRMSSMMMAVVLSQQW